MGDVIDETYCFYDHFLGKYTEHLTLNREQEELLVEFCKIMFKQSKTKKGSSTNTSYSYKKMAENFLGFYIANCDMKKAMCKAKIKPFNEDYKWEKNWRFYVSIHSPLIEIQYSIKGNPGRFNKLFINYIRKDKN